MNRREKLTLLGFILVVSFVLIRLNAEPAPTKSFKLAPAGTLSLITEPEAGVTPVLEKINGAKKSVDLVMYQLEDSQVEQALASAEARGVSVRVLLNGGYWSKKEGDNAAAFSYLQSKGVNVRSTPTYFALTHEKALVVDGNDALIMTFNLTPQYYVTSRDFAVDDRDANDVSAIEQVFAADWQGEEISAPTGDDLVWSPDSRSELISVIGSATSTLEIYNEEMNDPSVTTALEEAAGRGVKVEVCMTDSNSWHSAFADLRANGVKVKTFAPSASLYIHAKVIIADGRLAFVGSENFSPTSLDDNRELGLVLSDGVIISALEQTFQTDWRNATM